MSTTSDPSENQSKPASGVSLIPVIQKSLAAHRFELLLNYISYFSNLHVFQGPPRHLGMILWAAYQIGNAVIIMNLLIALMNAIIAGIQEDKITHLAICKKTGNGN